MSFLKHEKLKYIDFQYNMLSEETGMELISTLK